MNNTITLGAWDTFKFRFFDDKRYLSRRKVYNSLWAVLFGFIVSAIVISFTGNNPFLVFASLFQQGTTTFGNKLISIFIAYLFASLAVAICFKGGLFNIGISGQMMAAGFTTLLIFRSELLTHSSISGGSIVLALFISILIGALVALLAGCLKSFFGVNEVVSTIMLNWIIFFLVKFLVQDLATWEINGATVDFLATSDSLASNLSSGYNMPNFFYPQDVSNSWFANYWNWIIISLAIIVVIFVWFVLSKTSFGYKIKMVGLNKDASEYSGTNQKSLTLIVMAISGGLSGLAGFIWYIGQGGQIDIADQPLLAGFDAVAISLLVFNNPIGVVLSSFVYSILSVGSSGLSSEFPGMQKEIDQVIIGIFIYCAAITVVFSKLNVYTWVHRFIMLHKYDRYWKSNHKMWKARWVYFKDWFKVKKEIHNLKSQHRKDWGQINNKYKNLVQDLEKHYAGQNNKFEISKLTEQQQVKYFEQIAKLKKEKDGELFLAHYFDIESIKSKRIIEFQKEKENHNHVKTSLINEYKQSKNLKKELRKAGR